MLLKRWFRSFQISRPRSLRDCPELLLPCKVDIAQRSAKLGCAHKNIQQSSEVHNLSSQCYAVCGEVPGAARPVYPDPLAALLATQLLLCHSDTIFTLNKPQEATVVIICSMLMTPYFSVDHRFLSLSAQPEN